MKLLLAFALFAAVVFAARYHDQNGILTDEEKLPAINDEMVAWLNNQKGLSWKAGRNPVFEGKTLKEVKQLLGAKTGGYFHRHGNRKSGFAVEALPTSFDSRAAWPNCTSIGTILNQAKCGSCWAFGATEAISDRFCIESQGALNITLSEMDMVTCDNNDDGCEGGDPYSAWSFAQSAGLVTSQCSPYTIPTCPPAEQPCLNFVNTPNCNRTCANGAIWKNDKHYVASVYNVGGMTNNVADIATEIMKNGPVEGAFSVYEDFVHYKSGVYKHTTGGYLGGHAIKIIGWGVDSTSGLDYWLVANSWTTSWGDNGYFMIEKGVDECGIEDGIVAGTVKVTV